MVLNFPLNELERAWSASLGEGVDLLLEKVEPIKIEAIEDPLWLIKAVTDSANALDLLTCSMPLIEGTGEALWVLGLGQGLWIEPMIDWLEQDKSRFLVVIEPALAFMRTFLRDRPLPALKCMTHPQIALLAFSTPKPIRGRDLGLSLASQLLSDSSAMGYCHPILNELFDSIPKEAELIELWQSLQQWIDDARIIRRHHLLAPDIMAHTMRNLMSAGSSRMHQRLGPWLRDLPVILCGAGPSLTKQLNELRRLKGKALIISCGTASQVLQANGFEPDWLAAICSYEANYERFRRLDFLQTPTFTGLRVHPGVMRLMSEEKLMLRSIGGNRSLEWLEEPFDQKQIIDSDYGTSVLTATLKACVEMGARQIALVGVDLCYLDQRKYGEGIDAIAIPQALLSSESESLSAFNGEGQRVQSQAFWLQERDWIEHYLSHYPDLQLYQTSSRGLSFKGAQTDNLEVFHRDVNQEERDLASYSWVSYQEAKPSHFSDRKAFIMRVHASLQSAQNLCDKFLKEVKKASLSNVDSAEHLLEKYLLAMGKELTFEGFLSWIDHSMASLQLRQKWAYERDPRQPRPQVQRMRQLTLLAERISVMSQRIEQLQSALEDMMGERDWPWQGPELRDAESIDRCDGGSTPLVAT